MPETQDMGNAYTYVCCISQPMSDICYYVSTFCVIVFEKYAVFQTDTQINTKKPIRNITQIFIHEINSGQNISYISTLTYI